MKKESVDSEKTYMTEVASASVNVPPPKQSTQYERVQRIIEKDSPEELESEMRSSQHFLEKLKAPLANMASVNQDAQYWIQQIGEAALLSPRNSC